MRKPLPPRRDHEKTTAEETAETKSGPRYLAACARRRRAVDVEEDILAEETNCFGINIKL